MEFINRCGEQKMPILGIFFQNPAQPCRYTGFDYSNFCMADNVEPDAALMLRVKRGDIRAFEELVEKYKHPVINVITRILHDQTDVAVCAIIRT